MKLLWYSAGNIIYVFGSLGYLAINIINLLCKNTFESKTTYIILVILASVFVLDALLYTADWFEQYRTKTIKELIVCSFNIIGSVLYLLGAINLNNKKTSFTTSIDLSDIPMFIFNIVGILAFLIESILNFYTPRVSKTISRCSIEYFAHLLNLFGNLTYLIAHIIQPLISFIASFTIEYLNRLADFIYFIILRIQIGGDIIYTIDAILYVIVWIKANQHLRKIGATWTERVNITTNGTLQNRKSNMITSELIIDRGIQKSTDVQLETISKAIPQLIVENIDH